MLALRHLTRKFLDIKIYCVNALEKKFSVNFAFAKNALNEFFKVLGAVLLEGSAKFSAWEVLLYSFTETDKSFFPFSVFD